MLCVYCSDRRAVTGDHVFARSFFIERARGNLPQVPTCDVCNNAKSNFERYLTALFPFGGRHADAQDNLAMLVPGRLVNNVRLARELNAGRHRIWHREEGVYRPSMALPVDSVQVCSLFALIARALAWYHWQAYLSAEHASEAMFLSAFGREYFNRLFSMNAKNRVHQDLGNATVSYRGVQAIDTPQLTLWRITFYGGIMFAGDPQQPSEMSTEFGAITGPRRLVAMQMQRTQNET